MKFLKGANVVLTIQNILINGKIVEQHPVDSNYYRVKISEKDAKELGGGWLSSWEEYSGMVTVNERHITQKLCRLNRKKAE